MLCGVTRILSRIKHFIFFSFSKKYRPFETNKCHQCLWCKFFDVCKREHEHLLRLDSPPAYYEWMKTHKDKVYGSSLSYDELENQKKLWGIDNNGPLKDKWYYIDLTFTKDYFEGYKNNKSRRVN